MSLKLVTAVIKPHRLEEVRTALTDLGVTGFTAWEVRGFGRQRGHQELYRGSEYQVNFIPKMKIEVVVAASAADAVIAAIEKTAATGTLGDGKIFVLDCPVAVRIRTGERQEEAL
ncbi:MAG: P-II family nitrogen regulator [Candidatus Sumerlaeia bacterium]|nr:P-II family nitrogen regulator [Candidatus Sumerlaeia bacterium]